MIVCGPRASDERFGSAAAYVDANDSRIIKSGRPTITAIWLAHAVTEYSSTLSVAVGAAKAAFSKDRGGAASKM